MDLNKRLSSIIQKDKEHNPKRLINVIKSDFFYLISNYFEVDFNDVKIDYEVENGKYNIKIECVGDRIKMMKVLS